MPKYLIFVAGTMGVGKTAVCQELKKMLSQSVFLDGDWCWDMHPFTVNEETKELVQANIADLLNRFLSVQSLEYVIFCWVMHERMIMDEILSRLDLDDVQVRLYALSCSREALSERIMKDVKVGVREIDVLERSKSRLACYPKLGIPLIDTTNLTAKETAEWIYRDLTNG